MESLAMLRLVVFAILLSQFVPMLLVSCFETFGAGSATDQRPVADFEHDVVGPTSSSAPGFLEIGPASNDLIPVIDDGYFSEGLRNSMPKSEERQDAVEQPQNATEVTHRRPAMGVESLVDVFSMEINPVTPRRIDDLAR